MTEAKGSWLSWRPRVSLRMVFVGFTFLCALLAAGAWYKRRVDQQMEVVEYLNNCSPDNRFFPSVKLFYKQEGSFREDGEWEQAAGASYLFPGETITSKIFGSILNDRFAG